LFERYQAGARRQVWDDLVALGPAVFEPEWHADAVAVAATTMERAASNVATIVERLNRMGYRFAVPYWDSEALQESHDRERLRAQMVAAGEDPSWVDGGEPDQFAYTWAPRRGARREQIERADRIVGPLPISLRALWSNVGEVALQGSFLSWVPSAFAFEDELPWPEQGLYSAPLNLSDERAMFGYCTPGTDDIDARYRDDAGRFRYSLGADEIHGAGFSGGSHTVLLPQPTADPVVQGVRDHDGIRLVEYLRLCFDWGGFPGFASTGTAPAEIAALREGLLPI
jgi:hypothetical protein